MTGISAGKDDPQLVNTLGRSDGLGSPHFAFMGQFGCDGRDRQGSHGCAVSADFRARGLSHGPEGDRDVGDSLPHEDCLQQRSTCVCSSRCIRRQEAEPPIIEHAFLKALKGAETWDRSSRPQNLRKVMDLLEGNGCEAFAGQ